MPGELEIENILVTAPQLGRPDRERGEQQEFLNIEIWVTNQSAKKTYHVISSIRSLDYDPTTHTLTVGLSEPEPDPKMIPVQIHPPRQIVVSPKESTAITVLVPVIIKRIRPSNTLGLNIEKLDISRLEHVICRVAYNETPYYPELSATAAQKMKKLRLWGRTSEKRTNMKIPPVRGSTKLKAKQE